MTQFVTFDDIFHQFLFPNIFLEEISIVQNIFGWKSVVYLNNSLYTRRSSIYLNFVGSTKYLVIYICRRWILHNFALCNQKNFSFSPSPPPHTVHVVSRDRERTKEYCTFTIKRCILIHTFSHPPGGRKYHYRTKSVNIKNRQGKSEGHHFWIPLVLFTSRFGK